MTNALKSKIGQWCLAAVIGLVMGFIVGPLVTSSVLHETLQYPLQGALAIISFGLAGLTIEMAVKRSNNLAAAFVRMPDEAPSELDKIFGAGRIAYTVTPADNGQIQLNIVAINVSSALFQNHFRSLLASIDGIEWKPATDLDGNAFASPPGTTMSALVVGLLQPEASLSKAIEGLERVVGKPQPL